MHSRHLAILTAASLGAASVFASHGATGQPVEDDIGQDAVGTRVEAIVQAALDSELRGISIAVAFGTETLLETGWGQAPDGQPADDHSMYGGGALLDPLLRVAALTLVQEGELGLDDRIHDWFPELEELEDVRVHHLLSHTSGLADYHDWGRGDVIATDLEREPVIAKLASIPLEFEPSTCLDYSPTNSLLLGWILSDVTELDVQDILMGRVLEPAGMDCSTIGDGAHFRASAGSQQEIGGVFDSDSGGTLPFGMAGLETCVSNLLSFQRALIDRELLGETLTTRFMNSASLSDGSLTQHGFGMSTSQLGRYTCHSIGGSQGGSSVRIAYYPSFDLSLILLAESDGDGGQALRPLERRIVRSIFDLPEPGVETRPLPADEQGLYVGGYALGCNQIRITFEEDHLVFDGVDFPRYEFHFQGRHGFVAEDEPDVRITFEVADGRAESFVLNQYGRESIATRFD